MATHALFVASSVNGGFTYKLTPDEQGEVTISEAIPASKGNSYITVVSEIFALTEAAKFLRLEADEHYMDSTADSRSGGRCWLVGQ